ncbi:MAG: DeoR/GlpR transcriptional regulator [Lachnospiraceae bacterium]|nr:DeoR/GlpR transcriptional regulator [Lachnospiraceae bacterium]MEE1256658.1 DeoR/GlpR family DNA-binding transcription regulator [Lachnospiraceae bacterium]
MLYEERVNYILKKLEHNSLVKTNDLVNEMGVSIDTIRRDLKKLEEEGKLTCIRGGACSSEEELQYSPFFGRQIINEDLKREAAKKATSLIHSGNIIALNAGTTNSILAEELVKLKKQITVVTNNLSALSILTGSEYIQIVVPSGIVDKEELALYGCNCVEEISSYSFDLSFLAINAVHPIYGFSDFRFQEMDIIKTMIKHSKRSVALMDSQKFGKISKKVFLSPREISLLITNNQIDYSLKNQFTEAGLCII